MHPSPLFAVLRFLAKYVLFRRICHSSGSFHGMVPVLIPGVILISWHAGEALVNCGVFNALCYPNCTCSGALI